MDFHLKQWKNESEQVEDEEEQQHTPSVKMPKLLLDSNINHQYSSSTAAAPLSLFVADEPSCKISHLSAFSDSTQLPSSLSVSESDSPAASSNATRSFPKMGGGGGGAGSGRGSYFSWAQRQELELQALIYKYMEMGAAVPLELLQPIKKSLLLHSSPYFLHHPFQHYSYYHPDLLQTGYWGRAAMDPEPGRCRRTDGKKWRCSRDVVAGQKYCERHVHRGRSRSRKPVEIPTPTSCSVGTSIGEGGAASAGGSAFNTASSILAPPLAAVNSGNNNSTFRCTGQSSSTQFLHCNNYSNGPPETKTNRNDGRILRHFFDDWPSTEPDSNNSRINTATCLSISMPGNSASDVSLKLATGDGEREMQQPQLNWNGGGWGTAQVASMGGPLAEALRSSVTNSSSPTSVLHHLPRASASESSFVTA